MNAISSGTLRTLRPSKWTGLPRWKAPDVRQDDGHGIGWRIWTLVAVLFFAYMLVALRIHERMLSNCWDLAIFEQAVRSYAHGMLPVSEVKGRNHPLLGDHFSPILALLAPAYMVWSSAKTLLIAQAGLLAASVIPLALWVRRAFGQTAALVIGSAYGLSWGIASAVGFDFHEWAFAVPLLAASLAALGQGRLRAASWWAMPMLLVKEDMGLAVCVIGLLIARRGDRRTGLVTAGIGLLASLLAVFVIIPAFSETGGYQYWFGMNSTGSGGLGTMLYDRTIGMITPLVKVRALLLALVPTLFLALRSSIIWVAFPTFLWRFASNHPPDWSTGNHYSLLVMTIVFAAFIDALVRRRPQPSSLRRYLAATVGVTLMLLPQFPLWQLVKADTWRDDIRIGVARSVMRLIPDDATVQASNFLVPQLANRTRVSMFGWYASPPNPEWIMVDTFVPLNRRWPQSFLQERDALAAVRAQGYTTVADNYGYVLLHRRG
ncbi:DUF2079 domain-containing protein [Streptomyces sp. NPDC086787]|uniref:DUF2079 domain-containing protein n=1 Tax=Streptomyces sp. NPDC086787 TaxID=3365759 RepID=UPI00381C194E